MSYKEIGSEARLKLAFVRGANGLLEPASTSAAISVAAARLRRVIDAKGPGVVAAVASAHATNEDLYTLRRLLEALGTETSGVAVPLGAHDDLLVKAEKVANAAGARALGFGDAQAVVDRVRGGGVDALIVLGHDLLDPGYAGDPSVLSHLDTVIVLDTHRSELERVAHVLLPVRHAAEKAGTLTNHSGRAQRIQPAVEPAWEASADGEILARLGAALGLTGFDGKWDVRSVSRELGALPGFAGADLASVGDLGRPLSSGSPAGALR
jgi:predicted molibdopterin-dependent oxidoreductase YjgC